jgi:hypothetical protein
MKIIIEVNNSLLLGEQLTSVLHSNENLDIPEMGKPLMFLIIGLSARFKCSGGLK